MENFGFDEMEDKMETIWQVKVTKKPMDEKNELKMMEMGLQKEIDLIPQFPESILTSSTPVSNMGYSLGKEDLKVVPLMKSMVAELVGTMFLVIIGCGAAMQWKTDFDTTQVSLAFGLAVMAIASFTGHVSGGNLNPAVSVGLLAGGKLSLLKCVVYVIAQCIGAVIGAGILHLVTPSQHRAGLGSNGLADGVTPLGGMVMELLMTMLLVLVVYATAVDTGNKTAPMVAPLVIGLTVTAAHLVLMPYTGTSINPARSLGPALVSSNTANHWVFWVGPLLGGALGGVLYRFGMMNNQDS